MKKPVFIIGCPRSGTTMILDILASHEDFAWISQHVNRYPKRLSFGYFQRMYYNSSFGLDLYKSKKKFRNIIPIPSEPWNFFNHYLKNFQWEINGSIPPRLRTEKDISKNEIHRFQSVIEKACKIQKKDRFLSKYTDFPRITYLKQVFPDAKFIHLLRDGRAVANSYYNKIKKGDFNTWDERKWWIKGWPKEWKDDFLKNHNNPIGFVAYQWKFFIDLIWQDSKNISQNDYIEVRYENILNESVKHMKNILDFCEMPDSKRMDKYIDYLRIENMNVKWKKQLNNDQHKTLKQIITEDRFKKLLEI